MSLPVDELVGSSHRPISRRRFLARAGWAGLGAALLQLPAALRGRGWLDEAAAADPNLTIDTINGLVAFVVPGPDEYSVAQGQSSPTPGGMASGTTENLIANLDAFLPAPDLGPYSSGGTVPLSGAVANMLNTLAATVNPAAAGGAFPSHFSRLAFDEKAEVFRQIEGLSGDDDASRNIRFVGGILPGFTAFLAFGEWHALDPATRTLTGRPVGWDLSRYQPGRTVPAEGWDELQGYFEGRKKAQPRKRRGNR